MVEVVLEAAAVVPVAVVAALLAEAAVEVGFATLVPAGPQPDRPKYYHSRCTKCPSRGLVHTACCYKLRSHRYPHPDC